VACNTVSAVSLDAIKSSLGVPVIGVIEPGARAAVAATRKCRIGVIGTSATVRSSSYARAINAADPSVAVFALPCPLFVPLVEEGWTDGPIVEQIAERYLGEIKEKDIDTLVLGCTHYPLLKGVLAKVMGDRVTLIDSAIETAAEVEKTLRESSLLSKTSSAVSREFYVTDSPEKFTEVGERFLGSKIEFIRKIELGAEV
jgi:glutamate racemase